MSAALLPKASVTRRFLFAFFGQLRGFDGVEDFPANEIARIAFLS